MQAAIDSGSAFFATSASAFSAPESACAADTAGATGRPAVESHSLLRGQKTVTIHHNGALYRLQTTRLGKLILTK